MMRVTLALNEEVHASAKANALRDKKTFGQVITELERLGMERAILNNGAAQSNSSIQRNK